jgi:hypothetical protein
MPTLEIPGGRPFLINRAYATNRFVRAKEVAYWLDLTRGILQLSGWTPWTVPVIATFHGVYAKGPWPDPDGIIPTAKAALDAMVLEHLLVNDTAKFVPFRVYGPPVTRDWSGILMKIEEAP